MKLVTAAQMRALEEAAVAAGGSLDELMAAAGLAVAQEAWMQLGQLEDRRIAVLVGPGNNGGDGLVAARHLAEWGAQVRCYALAPRDDPQWTQTVEAGIPCGSTADDDADLEALRALVDQRGVDHRRAAGRGHVAADRGDAGAHDGGAGGGAGAAGRAATDRRRSSHRRRPGQRPRGSADRRAGRDGHLRLPQGGAVHAAGGGAGRRRADGGHRHPPRRWPAT